MLKTRHVLMIGMLFVIVISLATVVLSILAGDTEIVTRAQARLISAVALAIAVGAWLILVLGVLVVAVSYRDIS